MISYKCSWTVLDLDKQIDSHFLVAVHTMNVCDAELASFKRRLEGKDARTPLDIKNIIEEISSTTIRVSACTVKWKRVKDIVAETFMFPSKFRNTK